ncbi:MAG: hypothetical protein AABN33_18500 [Acidobacteriota bacterium]
MKLLATIILLLALTVVGVTQQQTPEIKAQKAGVPLSADDLRKIDRAYQTASAAYLDLERAKARHEQTVSEFNRLKAEIIGDHGLAPSKHDFSPDGKRIVPKAAEEPSVQQADEKPTEKKKDPPKP